MTSTVNEEVTDTQASIKKRYQPPLFRVYGTIQEMTRTVHMGTQSDALKYKYKTS